jgi:proline dehydrogenase
MLRALLIYLSKAAWMKNIVMKMGLARRVVRRFVAGETLEEAIAAIRELNQRGLLATLDQLGEDTTTPQEAKDTAAEIKQILDGIHESGIRSNLSLKLTQIGLSLDEALCSENLAEILDCARHYNIFVRIDMEDSPFTDATLRIYWQMRNDRKFENVGIVIQSYLYRSEEDVRQLLAGGARIRMVKGAYREPPDVAFPEKADVDRAFDELTRQVLDCAYKNEGPSLSEDGRWPPAPAVASHDEARIQFARAYAGGIGLAKDQVEFQMLYGIRRDLQEKLSNEGYPVRVYVPFGTQWYPYFMRRLAERPANLWFFIAALFSK